MDVVSGILHDREFISSDQLKEERLAICKACPYYKDNRCEACGCLMNLKAALVKAKCPKGFWKEKLIEKVMFGTFSNDFKERDCCNGGI